MQAYALTIPPVFAADDKVPDQHRQAARSVLTKGAPQDEKTAAIEAHAQEVYRIALHMLGNEHDAQDAAQDTLFKAWQKRRQLKEIGRVRVWLLTITANTCRDRLRRATSRRKHAKTEPIQHDHQHPQTQPQTRLQTSETLSRVQRLIQALPAKQSEALYLSAVCGLTHDETAEVMGINKRNLAVTLTRARKRLLEAARKEGLDV